MTHGVLAPQSGTFAERRTVNGSRRVPVPWVRPSDWLPLVTPGPSEDKVVGLAAVNPVGSNYVALRCVGSGDFTVDWGDGLGPQVYSSGDTAERDLAWSDYGDVTSEGFRQAVVTVVPQSGSWSAVEWWRRHSALSVNGASSPWLDVRASVPGGSFTLSAASSAQFHSRLVQFEAVTPIVAAVAFYPCRNLRSVVLAGTTGSNFNSMFYGCSSLSAVPALDTSSGTNFSNMFTNCLSLSAVPALDTSSGTSFNNMFYGCSSLSAVPALDTSSGTNFSSMFTNCSSLSAVPALDTSSGTNFSSMFTGCSSLSWSAVTGTRYGISYAFGSLNTAALNTIFTGLGTAGGSQTITITGNPGTSTANATIATSKGWTVAA